MKTTLAMLFHRLFGQNATAPSSAKRPYRRRLELETLEGRITPALASGALNGVAFIDANQNAVRDAGESAAAGITVKLTGTTSQGVAVSVSTETDANGAYTFQNLLPGAYQFATTNNFLIPNGSTSADGGDRLISNVVINGGETVALDAAFRGLDPRFVSLRALLTSADPEETPWGGPGEGSADVNYRANNTPSLRQALQDRQVAMNASPTTIDLAAFFTDTDITNSLVRFETSSGSIKVELFDKDTPQTVANFFNYVTSDRYDATVFHRLISNFVVQGGGYKVNTDLSALLTPANKVASDGNVNNEFGVSNTTGTIAMAKTPGDPNSATSEFFFNLANNNTGADHLDIQNGGFTVFGKIVDASDTFTLNSLKAIPTPLTQTGFEDVPLRNYTTSNFPAVTEANLALLNDVVVVRRDEFLSYSVIGNTNPSLLTTSIVDNRLKLTYAANQTGTATITLRATDRYGASFDASFSVTVS